MSEQFTPTVQALRSPQAVKTTLTLDKRQKQAALLIASGELDTFIGRIGANVQEIEELKSAYLEALMVKDRDESHACLMNLAGAIDRLSDTARHLGVDS